MYLCFAKDTESHDNGSTDTTDTEQQIRASWNLWYEIKGGSQVVLDPYIWIGLKKIKKETL